MKKKLKYKSELIRSMNYLSKKKNTIFLGQSVLYSGNAIYGTLSQVPSKKKLELPVFEDVQMGMSIGLALDGYVPITCFPRFDFLVLAFNQMVNHLDKIQRMSDRQFQPKVIIRTSIGSKYPLDGGLQHTQDYTKTFKEIFGEIKVISLNNPNKIYSTFKKAYSKKENSSYLIIEKGDYYNER